VLLPVRLDPVKPDIVLDSVPERVLAAVLLTGVPRVPVRPDARSACVRDESIGVAPVAAAAATIGVTDPVGASPQRSQNP